MSRAILILAKNIREANSYAKLAELPRFSYRAVQKAGSIRGVRNAEVHILPSFLVRPDRHAIMAALRNTRLDVYYVDPADLLPPSYEVILDKRGDLTHEQLSLAYRAHSIFEFMREDRELADEVNARPLDTGVDSTSPSMLDGEALVEAEPVKQRRRTRCAKCGALHFSEEPCESLPVTTVDFF